MTSSTSATAARSAASRRVSGGGGEAGLRGGVQGREGLRSGTRGAVTRLSVTNRNAVSVSCSALLTFSRLLCRRDNVSKDGHTVKISER